MREKSGVDMRGHRGIRMAALVALLTGLGCAEKKKAGMYDRSEEAMKDPFNYSPEFEKPDTDHGGISDWDSDGMRKDVDNVLNP